MANTIIGKIQSIGQTVNVSKKEKPFYKRELVLNASRFDPYTGEERRNIITISFIQGNCHKLDDFKAGDFVEVSFVLQGREYAPQGGAMRYLTDVVGFGINYHATNSAKAPVSVPAPPSAPSAPQAPVAPPPPSYPPYSIAPSDNQSPFPPMDVPPSDLPF